LHLFIEQEFDPFRAQSIPPLLGSGESLSLQAGQIPIWLSFLPSLPDDVPCPYEGPPPEARHFGAIFDTGCGHTLSVAERHLAAGKFDLNTYIDTKRPLHCRSVHGAKAVVERLLGCLWIHSNLPQDREGETSTLMLSLRTEGIALYRSPGENPGAATVGVGGSGPRVPVLGARALALARIDVRLEYSTYESSHRMARALFYAPERSRSSGNGGPADLNQ
jgi:hypothetical protein